MLDTDMSQPIVTADRYQAHAFMTEAEADAAADALCRIVKNRGNVEVVKHWTGDYHVRWDAPTGKQFWVWI